MPRPSFDTETIYSQLAQMLPIHSPSGFETAMDEYLKKQCLPEGRAFTSDAAENLVLHLPGRAGTRRCAITAHKDEIGGFVKEICSDGVLRVGPLGGSHPWVYGEGPVNILGTTGVVNGIMSFGSRHVSDASSYRAIIDGTRALKWDDVRVLTMCSTEELSALGVRPGTRIVPSVERKQAIRMKEFIAGYTLDNRAALAIILRLAQSLEEPNRNLYLVATSQEEVGGSGVLFFSRQVPVDELIALDVAPISDQYGSIDPHVPVLLAADSLSFYDEPLTESIRLAAVRSGTPTQTIAVEYYCNDASIARRSGQIPQIACLAFPTYNTHGFEITSLQAISRCAVILTELLSGTD